MSSAKRTRDDDVDEKREEGKGCVTTEQQPATDGNDDATAPPAAVDFRTASVERIRRRKKDHIDVCLNKPVEPFVQSNGGDRPSIWSRYRLPYTALPNCNLSTVSTKCTFFSSQISAPIIISSMTGGEDFGTRINTNLAIACNAEDIPFGLGSMRVVKNHPEAMSTFNVKHLCPQCPMFANIGLVQLNYGFTNDDVAKLIADVKADGLFIHLNHVQEAVQPEGDTNFTGLVEKLSSLAKHLRGVPIVVKSVGHGIDRATARTLIDCGVRCIDVSGVGGTSWAWVEGWRQPSNNGANDPMTDANLGFLFRDVGITTDECLIQCVREIPEVASGGVQLIAGGGIRSGVDVAKAITLGASYGTAALPFLSAALESSDAVRGVIQKWKHELRVAMFTAGVSTIAELRAAGATGARL